jgi:hypothetical protein
MQQPPHGFPLPFALLRHQYVRNLWAQRTTILIWLLEHAIIFLAAKGMYWACGPDGDIDDWSMLLGSITRAYLKHPEEPQLARGLSYTFMTDLGHSFWCMLALWLPGKSTLKRRIETKVACY